MSTIQKFTQFTINPESTFEPTVEITRGSEEFEAFYAMASKVVAGPKEEIDQAQAKA